MRVLVRLLSCLLGLAIAAVGGLLATEVTWWWVQPGSPPLLVPWHEWLRLLGTLNWASLPVRITAWSVAAAGLLLVLFAAAARRRDVRLNAPAPEITVTTSPRSLARTVGNSVRAAEGVTGASVTASRRRVRVRATSALKTEDQLRPRLTELAREVVGALPLPHTPSVSVVVDSPRDRR
ncbi:DUF6286 domain-containing protein [Kutzneria albida]|uniref:Putative secreted protein n=1 Tax=Kutzneria albida DSM 43870 TaxID=1449976 RepID=W5W433_9PSEU|nr:DUF6286 domain-containing protein [Kutzneria albida]AHH95998.1 putative secreted protein [Kutzneria albida DSM 43870]